MASARKFKAELGQLKTFVSSIVCDDEDTPKSIFDMTECLSSAYCALLAAELRLRGVNATIPITMDTLATVPGNVVENRIKMFDTVTNTAGKSVVDEASGLPRPLLAGAFALAGIAAEKCASACVRLEATINSEDWSSTASNFERKVKLYIVGALSNESNKLISSALRRATDRCKEVNDERLALLLQMSFLFASCLSDMKWSDRDSAKFGQELGTLVRSLRLRFLIVAKGQYLWAAAKFAQDQPQMWRKALDISLLIHSTRLKATDHPLEPNAVGIEGKHLLKLKDPSDIQEYQEYQSYHTKAAVLPLQNLARITHAKGNLSRSSELYLRIAEASLGEDATNVNGDGFSSSSYEHAFVDKKDSNEDRAKTATTASSCAKKALANCDRTIFESDKDRQLFLLHSLVCFRVEIVEEGELIDRLACDQLLAAKKRVSDDTCRTQVKRVGTSNATDEKAPDKAFFELRSQRAVLMDNLGGSADLAGESLLSTLLEIYPPSEEDSTKGEERPPSPIPALQTISKKIKVSSGLIMASFHFLELNLHRLIARAQAVALCVAKDCKGRKYYSVESARDYRKPWASVASFASSIIRSLPIAETSNSVASSLVKTSSTALLTVSWMTAVIDAYCGDESLTSPLVSSDDLTVATLQLKRMMQEERSRVVPKDEYLRTSEVDNATSHPFLAIAYTSGVCYAAILDNGNRRKDNEIYDIIQDGVISMSQQETMDHGRYGTAFLQFLLAWSGLTRTPWPFATVTQARAMIDHARTSVAVAKSVWGRPSTCFDEMLIDLGEADAEAFLSGGFVGKSYNMFCSLLARINEEVSAAQDMIFRNSQIGSVMKAHCHCGISQVCLHNKIKDAQQNEAEKHMSEVAARNALELISSTTLPRNDSCPVVLMRSAFQASLPYHLCYSRRLVAETLMRQDRVDEAGRFLEDAVKDSSDDFDAAFALGSFRLRRCLVLSENLDNLSLTEKKAASTQLLKAAKLNMNQAGPFALLGFWYEIQADTKRAIGCHSKALLLDPCHPVSGRGILRLKPLSDVKNLCEVAAASSSAVNGWAWVALGISTGGGNGNDTIAAAYFQRGLRCRDIENPEHEDLSPFFHLPSATKSDVCSGGSKHSVAISNAFPRIDAGTVWSYLASSYRRLGKYSAAMMAYHCAYEATGGKLHPHILYAWAQVEMELGLFDGALGLFNQALELRNLDPIAAFGRAACLLQSVKRSSSEGKFGLAHSYLTEGIASLLDSLVSFQDEGRSPSEFSCVLKLLGDMYSFGVLLPFDVFLCDAVNSSTDEELEGDTLTSRCFQAQLSFVAKGEQAYQAVLNMAKSHDSTCDGDGSFSVATSACDLGSNQLAQARVVAASLGEGSGGLTKTTLIDVAHFKPVQDMLNISVKSFLTALNADEFLSPAWCGLGCALIGTDPLLAQHCFCRSIALDKSLSDSWANLSFVYIEYSRFAAGCEMLDGLTQVADSPLMWIGRGLLLERSSSKPAAGKESKIAKAADAFRTALQIAQHPSALLGLSVTSRRIILKSDNIRQSDSTKASLEESLSSMLTYLDSPGGCNIGAKILGALMEVEAMISCQITPKEILLARSRDKMEESRLSLYALENFEHKEMDKRGVEKLKRTDVVDGISLMNEVNTALTFAGPEFKFDNMSGIYSDSTIIDGVESAFKAVHANPDNGKDWLLYAKELVLAFTRLARTKSSSRKAKTLMCAGRVAINRALSLLRERCTSATLVTGKREGTTDFVPNENSEDKMYRKAVSPVFTDSTSYAAALVLKHWIEEEVENKDRADESNTNLFQETRSHIHLQRALIVDPENEIARQGLRRSISRDFGTVSARSVLE